VKNSAIDFALQVSKVSETADTQLSFNKVTFLG